MAHSISSLVVHSSAIHGATGISILSATSVVLIAEYRIAIMDKAAVRTAAVLVIGILIKIYYILEWTATHLKIQFKFVFLKGDI